MSDTPAAHAPSMLGGDWHRHGPLIEHSHLRGSFTHEHHPVTGVPTWPDAREHLGRLVRDTWVAWASEQPDPKPSWLVDWPDLDDGQREVDMRIGKALYDAGRAAERDEIRQTLEKRGEQIMAAGNTCGADAEALWKVAAELARPHHD